MLTLVFILIYFGTSRVVVANPTPSTPASSQSVPQLLASIEERLRGLSESINRNPSRNLGWNEGSIDILIRRLEAVETRLSRLDSNIELRFDKLSETLGGRKMKDELLAEQWGRKLDSTADRLNHRLGYLEAKVDALTTKITSRLESLPYDIQTAVTGAETRLSSQVENIAEQIREIQNVQSQSDSDNMEANEQYLAKALKDMFQAGQNKTKNTGVKFTGICDEMITQSQRLEELVKQNVAITNATQRQVQEAMGHTWHDMPSPDVEDLGNRMKSRLNDLGRRIDAGFQMMMSVQNMFHENCHMIQLEEPKLEKKISLVLERMLEAITKRHSAMKTEIQQLQQTLQTQKVQTIRSLTMIHDTLVNEQTSSDIKSLAKAIEQLGGLTIDGVTQILLKTPTAESVANLIAMDLKPLLLNVTEQAIIKINTQLNCSEDDTKISLDKEVAMEAVTQNSTNPTVTQERETTDSETTVTELAPDIIEPESFGTGDDVKSDGDQIDPFTLFSTLKDNNSLWRKFGQNMTFADILKTMMTRDKTPPVVEDDASSTTEDYDITELDI